MDDLWADASRDVEAEQQTMAFYRASAALEEELWPFLALSQSEAELEHRKALAMEPLQRIASESGMPLPELGAMIDNRFRILTEAKSACHCGQENCQCSGDCNCQSGCNCGNCRVASETTASLHKKAEEEEGGQWEIVDKNTGAKVAGPFDSREEAAEKLETGDFGLPASELAIEPIETEPEEGEGEGKEASRHHALQEGENILAETVPAVPGIGQPEKPVEHDTEADGSIPPDARSPQSLGKLDLDAMVREVLARKTAAGEQPNAPQGPPQPNEPAGAPPEGPEAPGELSGPPAPTSFPETTKPRQMPGGGSGDAMGEATDAMGDSAGGDPVGDQVDQVTATVRKHNPNLDEVTCRRVARKVVSRYLTAAGDDGINYVGGPAKEEEEENKAHPGESAAAGMAGRTLLKELPLLAV
jgi:hypothetical protein